jgi:hypothetical protein
MVGDRTLGIGSTNFKLTHQDAEALYESGHDAPPGS